MWPFKKKETPSDNLSFELDKDIKKIKLGVKKLKFDPAKHKYNLGKIQLTSVTDCIKTFFEPFNRDYWANYVADRDGKSTEKVLREWEDKRSSGDKVHQLIEEYIKGKQRKKYPNEVLMAIEFLKQFSNEKLTPEMMVYSKEWMVAGTIDLVIETPQGVILLDWKTTKNLRTENSYRKAKAPIDHLDDCNYVKYALQLNFYKELFERQFRKKVIEIGFVRLTNVEPSEYFPVEDLSREVELMMDYWRQKF